MIKVLGSRSNLLRTSLAETPEPRYNTAPRDMGAHHAERREPLGWPMPKPPVGIFEPKVKTFFLACVTKSGRQYFAME